MMLRVLICGGRHYTDYDRVLETLVGLGGKAVIEVVIHGAATGADTLGGRAAAKLGIPAQEFPANWNLYGKRAGSIRNQQMLDEGKPNICIAFPDPTSRGTWDMVRRAKKAGLEVKVLT
jgi:hypothetical protein